MCVVSSCSLLLLPHERSVSFVALNLATHLLQDKREGISIHIFWKDFLQIERVKGSEAIGVETLWRLFATFNYRGGDSLSYKEFVAACHVLMTPDPRLKEALIFVAFCNDANGQSMTVEDLKQLLLELIVGTRTSDWGSYPRQSVSMADFDSLITLMAEAAVAQVRRESTDASYGAEREFDISETTESSSGGSSGGGGKSGDVGGSKSVSHAEGDSPPDPAVSQVSINLEQWHKLAASQRHIQNLVAILTAAGSRVMKTTKSSVSNQ